MNSFYIRSITMTILLQSVILFTIHSSVHAQSDPLIRIRLSGTVYSDETVIRIKNTTTTNFDFDYDAYKIMSGGTTPSMYTYIGTTNYSINSIPASDSLPIINLGTKILEDGNYIMSFENSDGLHGYILIDKKLGVEVPVDSSSAYSFTGLIGDAINRFELQYKIESENKENSVPDNSYTVCEANITSSVDGIFVLLKNASEGQYKIEVLGMGGRVLKTITKEVSNSESHGEYIELSNLTAGNYLVKFTYNKYISSHHIIII